MFAGVNQPGPRFQRLLLEKSPDNDDDVPILTPALIKVARSYFLPYMDPRSRELRADERLEILAHRHGRDFVADCLETGNLVLDPATGEHRLITRLDLPQFMGFVFEAYLVRLMNDYPEVKARALAWCSNRMSPKAAYCGKFRAIATGHISTKQLYPSFYSTTAALDIIFIRGMVEPGSFEPLNVLGSTNQAGIQVKAIRGNERSEIIEPLLSGRYHRVLTCLLHRKGQFRYGVHTYYICMEIIGEMERDGSITREQRNRLEKSIFHPAQLGIDQHDIENYCEYAQACFAGQAKVDVLIESAVGMESTLYGSAGERAVLG